MTISDERFAQFAELAYERMRIYIKKELGFPKPWTDRPIFLDSFFCNVFRQLDKTSKWIITNVIEPNADDNYLWAMLVVARYISRIDCLEQLKEAGSFDGSYYVEDRLRITREQMLNRRAIGLPLNTGAFITSPMLGEWGPTKAHYIVHFVEALMDEDLGARLEYLDVCMREIHPLLMKHQAVGSFMAYQYCCDFSYVPRYLGKAPDLWSWSAMGPGSYRGMNRILFGTPYEKISKAEWLRYVVTLGEKWQEYIDRTIDKEKKNIIDLVLTQEPGTITPSDAAEWAMGQYGLFDEIRLQDVQHWLCEYDKYMRGGSSKRRYYGRST
jgi:hypothetical protein